MRREALVLVFAMFAATLLTAACEKQPQPKTDSAQQQAYRQTE